MDTTQRSEDTPRRKVELEVDCATEDMSEPVTLTTGDIGAGGLFIATDHPLDIGERFGCRFDLGDARPILAECEVAWVRTGPPQVEPSPGMGVRFVALEPEDIQRLRGWITGDHAGASVLDVEALEQGDIPRVSFQIEGLGQQVPGEFRAMSDDGMSAVAELPFLKVGSAVQVTVDEPGDGPRVGRIAWLVMEESEQQDAETPRIRLGIHFDPSAETALGAPAAASAMAPAAGTGPGAGTFTPGAPRDCDPDPFSEATPEPVPLTRAKGAAPLDPSLPLTAPMNEPMRVPMRDRPCDPSSDHSSDPRSNPSSAMDPSASPDPLLQTDFAPSRPMPALTPWDVGGAAAPKQRGRQGQGGPARRRRMRGRQKRIPIDVRHFWEVARDRAGRHPRVAMAVGAGSGLLLVALVSALAFGGSSSSDAASKKKAAAKQATATATATDRDTDTAIAGVQSGAPGAGAPSAGNAPGAPSGPQAAPPLPGMGAGGRAVLRSGPGAHADPSKVLAEGDKPEREKLLKDPEQKEEKVPKRIHTYKLGRKFVVKLPLKAKPKRVKHYFLANPDGAVVDAKGDSLLRPGRYKVKDARIRFVKVLKRSGATRFIVYYGKVRDPKIRLMPTKEGVNFVLTSKRARRRHARRSKARKARKARRGRRVARKARGRKLKRRAAPRRTRHRPRLRRRRPAPIADAKQD